MVDSSTLRGKKEIRSHYLKFDLTKSSIMEVPDLYDFFKATEAVRVCVIFKSHGAWERVSTLPVAYADDTNWHTIKIPAIDGTELWILPESKKVEVELKMGFGKSTESLLITSSKTIQALTFRDPLFRNEVRLRWKNEVICTSMTGATILSPTGDWTLEQLESLKDLGSIAFED